MGLRSKDAFGGKKRMMMENILVMPAANLLPLALIESIRVKAAISFFQTAKRCLEIIIHDDVATRNPPC